MKVSETRIWEAAYAAAYVDNFNKNREYVSFDSAVDCTFAEEAWYIADEAVRKFREWKKQEQPKGPKP